MCAAFRSITVEGKKRLMGKMKWWRLGDFVLAIAAPRSRWVDNLEGDFRTRQQQIVSLRRLYAREKRQYIWCLCAGRLKVLWFVYEGRHERDRI